MDYTNYFGLTSLISAFIWLIILSILIFYSASKIENLRDKKFFILSFYFKIFFAIAFSLYYILTVGGGDTAAYWEGALSIQNLISQDFFKGIEHFFVENSRENYVSYFNHQTGYPPPWIYSETESYFVSKFTAIVGFLSLKSYLATTFIFVYFIAHANWKLYETIKHSRLFLSKYTLYVVLLIPSVAFWCSGISKDTLMLVSIFYCFHFLYQLIKIRSKSIYHFIGLLFFAWIVFSIRNFMLITILIPLLGTILAYYNKKMNLAPVIRVPLTVFYLTLIIGGTVAFLASPLGNELILGNELVQEALVVQDDFKNNKTYGKNQYSIGEIDNSPFGIVKAMPASIFSGIYEPLPWNGLSVSLILNALESILLIYLTLRIFVKGNFIRWFNAIRKNELILFILIFVLMIAFIAGFTSVIYGVLVRIRAPLLPFVFLLLLTQYGIPKTKVKGY